MKSNKVFMLFVALLFLFVFGIMLKKHIPFFDGVKQASFDHDAAYNIAILVPVAHPAIDEIRQGFIETLNKSFCCVYDDYNANGNRTLLRSQAEAIVEKGYDLIFTIATGPALIMKEVCQQRHNDTPIVAGAVDDPLGLELINSMESSGNNVTAVTGEDFFDEQIKLLKFLKPSVKSILLVYNPTSGLDNKKFQTAQICYENNIGFSAVEIFNINDLIQKVPAVIKGHDTILVLKDNLVVSGIESLINLCNRMHKTLYASDLNSGDKGAALSYGVHEYDDGVESAKKAIEILKYGKKPTDVPSSVCKNFKIKVNLSTMKNQDLHIEPQLLTLIKSGETV